MTRLFCRIAASVLALGSLLSGQDAATLSITVVDPSDAFIPGAKLTLTDLRWGRVRQGETNERALALFDGLPPSDYSLEVVKAGFDRLRVERISLPVRARQMLRLELKVSAAQTPAVTVTAAAEGILNDTAHGISVDQSYIQSLPVNGRNAESLVLMAPGVTTAAGGRGGAGGGFNANGLRSNANYFTLDGVSLNQSVGGGPGGGGPRGPGGFAGAAPGFGAGGSTELINLDAMQELRVQTSPFAPEFGRTPGAQVAMTSRGGGNQLHGSVYYYLRNEELDANDWFANSSGLPRGLLRQNRPGGTLGGPIARDKTFFFGNFEVLRLKSPATVIATVPETGVRQTAAVALRPYLNAFPRPNGGTLSDGAALFRAQVINPSDAESASLRVDHMLTEKMTLFARYSTNPSESTSRGSEIISPNVLTSRTSRSHLATLGLTRAISPSLVNDLRVNYSRSNSDGTSAMDNFGGAVPLAEATVFPRGVTSATGEFNLSIQGVASYSIGSRSRNQQQQINAVNTLTKTVNQHVYKLGVDYRRIMPTLRPAPYSVAVIFNGLAGESGAMLSGVATNAQVSANLDAVYPLYTNFSAFAQDTFRATDRTTLSYGVRYDVNPAPGVRRGPQPLAIAQSSVAGVTQLDPLYETRWFNVAPRFGLSYQMDTTPGREMVFRTGFGVFYDLGYGISSGAFNGAPYSAFRTISSATFPLAAADLAPPALPPARPFGVVTTAERGLVSPLVYQWHTTIERYFARGQMLSLGYVASKGRKLMRTESRPSFSDAYDLLRIATNGASSDYNGFQVQFRRRLSASIQTQFSYTWAHAIDNSSTDLGFGGGFATLLGGDRGASDYDIRHNLNWSGSFRLPAPSKGALGAVLGNWYADWLATARTGLPFEVQGVSATTNTTDSTTTTNFRRGLFAQVRPNYTGLPVWIQDANVPGAKRLNRAAFAIPADYSQGNLGRNSLRGFPATQLDFSVRRVIGVTERTRLHLSAQAFNVLNHPTFANPSPQEGSNLSSPNFGVVTRMLNQSFGRAVNSTYRSGGARSLELVLRFQF